MSCEQGPGRCYRLYTEDAFDKLAVSPIPEIRRVSLTFALLHLLANGQDNVWEFEYMDAPDQESGSSILVVALRSY